MESDLSPRKIKVAAGILIGQSFGTSILPYSAMMLMLSRSPGSSAGPRRSSPGR